MSADRYQSRGSFHATEQLSFRGEEKNVEKAKDYVNWVRAQRVGPVKIDLNQPRDDLTVMNVPDDCVGFVMGRSGATLRSLEEEWGTLMFFARTDDRSQRSDEKLCIFGGLRARRGAELKVMSAVEHKHPGYCVNSRGELREIERLSRDTARFRFGQCASFAASVLVPPPDRRCFCCIGCVRPPHAGARSRTAGRFTHPRGRQRDGCTRVHAHYP